MMIFNFVKHETYYDSVFLMNLAEKAGKMNGIHRISVGMGTPLNKETLLDLGLLEEECRQASPNDLMIAIEADNAENARKAYEAYMAELLVPQDIGTKTYDSLNKAVSRWKDANIAVISVPGAYAAQETEKALNAGLNVFVFSDNVPIEEEARLKKLAVEKGLLLMGPDCGLSQINGIAIGLCSKVRTGNIGIVAATGSGMQEVMCMIHKAGYGVSQAIGTGGRDLNDAVGALTMCQVLDFFRDDDNTKAVVVISKPPQPEGMKRVLERIRSIGKPVVVQFIGCGKEVLNGTGAIFSERFADTAAYAVQLLTGTEIKPVENSKLPIEPRKMAPSQWAIRGLYCGGALGEETIEMMKAQLGKVYSNMTDDDAFGLKDPDVSIGHCIVDIGAEYFTKNHPHAAMEPSVRIDRFIREARDPETAVILLDFLLGYALHDDPAGAMAPVIAREKDLAKKEGRELYVVASICGSDLDPQDMQAQAEILLRSGVLLAENNAEATQWAIDIVRKTAGDRHD